MSNEYNTSSPKSSETPSNNGSSFVSRREMRASNVTGALPALGPMSAGIERSHTSSYEFEHLIQSLRELFEHDRQVASQPNVTRCGICYLYFSANELTYREEGFYLCTACEHSLGKQQLTMLRKQQIM
ncbi:MAG: hypothetical protein NVSMB49_24320 [Ktedonobacteraceae bacterium]